MPEFQLFHFTAPQQLLLGLSSIFVLGITAQWLAWRMQVPSILLLLGFGFLAGPGLNLIDPNALLGELLFPVVSVSVALILFEGSLSLRLDDLPSIGRALGNLLTIGVIITWVLCTAGSYWLLGLPLSTSLLLGAILVVTGPTVVGPMLQHIRPVGQVGPVARWEGIVIDPVGAVLAVLVYEAIEAVRSQPLSTAGMTSLKTLLATLAVGVILGTAGALLLKEFLRRHWLPDHLHSPATLMVVVGVFTASNLMQHEAGLITVTVMGVLLANQHAVSIRHIFEFKENLSVLLVSSLFILLAARLQFSQFGALGWRGPAFVAFVILLVRPVSVFASALGTSLTRQERIFLAWMAPRGIVAASVASVFALQLGEAGRGLVPATFLVIVGTVVVYGSTAGMLARRLELSKPNPQGTLIASAHPAARAIAHALQTAGFRVMLVDSNRWNIQAARLEGLPTVHANILSEQTIENVDLGGIGRLLAMTSNDEVNSLAALRFSELFGRSNVYQLVPVKDSRDRSDGASKHLSGRHLFERNMTYQRLDDLFHSGAVVKVTRLTPEFDFAAFRQRYGESASILFYFTDTSKLTVCTAESPPEPRSGQTVIAVVKVPENIEDSVAPDAESGETVPDTEDPRR